MKIRECFFKKKPVTRIILQKVLNEYKFFPISWEKPENATTVVLQLIIKKNYWIYF